MKVELACAVSARKAVATEKQARRARARGAQQDWEEPDVEVIEDADDDAPNQVPPHASLLGPELAAAGSGLLHAQYGCCML